MTPQQFVPDRMPVDRRVPQRRQRTTRSLRLEGLEQRALLAVDASLHFLSEIGDITPLSTPDVEELRSFETAIDETGSALAAAASAAPCRQPVLVYFSWGFGSRENDPDPPWLTALKQRIAGRLTAHGIPNEVHTMRWDSTEPGLPTRTFAGREAAKISRRLDQLSSSVDLLLVGHSRGGVFINDVVSRLGTHPKADFIQTIMIDPTASTLVHKDTFPRRLADGVDYAVQLDDGLTLNEPESGLSLPGLSRGKWVKDGIKLATEYRNVQHSMYAYLSRNYGRRPDPNSLLYSKLSHTNIHRWYAASDLLKLHIAEFVRRKDPCGSNSTGGNSGGGTTTGHLTVDENAPLNYRGFYSAGGQISLVGTYVHNSGSSSGEIALQYVLSSTETLDSAQVLKTVSRPGTSTDGSANWTDDVTIPVSLAPGTYYVGLLATTDQSTTLRAGPVRMDVRPMSEIDLSVGTINVEGAVPIALGTSFDCQSLAANAGTAASGTFQVSYYLTSSNPNSTAAAVLLKTVTRPGLPGNSGLVSWTETLQIPADSGLSGLDSIEITLDPAGQIIEGDELNNTAAFPVTVSPGVDLDLRDIRVLTARVNNFEEDPIVRLTVGNAGSRASDAFVVSFFLSPSATITNREQLVCAGGAFHDSLAPGGEASWDAEVSLPPDVKGQWYVLARVEHGGNDSRYANDELIKNDPLRIRPSIDLVPFPPTMGPAVVDIGNFVEVTLTVNKQRFGPADEFRVDYYLSADAVWSGVDPLIHTARRHDFSLSQGSATVTWSEVIQIPVDVTAGAYHVIAVVDRISAHDEAPTVLFPNDGEVNNVVVSGSIIDIADPAPFTVNAAPLNSPPGRQRTNLGRNLAFSSLNLNALTVSDPDAKLSDIRVTLTATGGTLLVPLPNGLTSVSGNGSSTIVMTGIQTRINAALDGLLFRPAQLGVASLQIETNDQGHRGTGGPRQDVDVVMIEVVKIPHGQLDGGFGADGTVRINFGSDSEEILADMAIQPDGRIVAAGAGELVVGGTIDEPVYQQSILIARYLSNGLLDTTFGTEGTVRTTFGAGAQAEVLAIQSDGKIIVVGDTVSGFDADDKREMLVVRYQPDGTLDATFGTAGVVIIPLGSIDSALDVALQSDGKIVVVGETFVGASSESSDWDFVLVRLHSNGALDTSFGAGGKVVTHLGPGLDTLTAVAIQPNGRIVVAGYSDLPDTEDAIVAAYNQSGQLDGTFGVNGVARFAGAPAAFALDLAALPDGRLVVVGGVGSFDELDLLLLRYTFDGRLDASFGAGGLVRTDFGFAFDIAHALTVQPDGRLVVVGESGDGTSDIAVAQYDANGRLVSDFGNGGTLVVDYGGIDAGYGVGLQAEGVVSVMRTFTRPDAVVLWWRRREFGQESLCRIARPVGRRRPRFG